MLHFEEACKQVARRDWAMQPVASQVTGRERANKLPTKGGESSQWAPGCLLRLPAPRSHRGGKQQLSEHQERLCSKTRHPAPPCKAAMNPFSVHTAIRLNARVHHPAHDVSRLSD